MESRMLLGSGGREAAMAWALEQSGQKVFCAPGNAGIAQNATCVDIDVSEFDRLIRFAKDNRVGLVVPGPEAPLVAGFAEICMAEGIPVCGPQSVAAQAEGSKSWFYNLLDRHNLPTPPHREFTDKAAALAYVKARDATNIVLKADGLAGGKGVTLPDTFEEAQADLDTWMKQGGPGETIVIQDRVDGVERSVMGVTDGVTTYAFPLTQDYKRLQAGDLGPNTGGMGAHTLELPAKERSQLNRLLRRVVKAFRAEGIPYRGFIYLGVMMMANGPVILECNCRMGDPETQVILPSISGNFTELCMAAATGNLASVPAPRRVRHALCVVLTSGQYPGRSDRDDVITGIDDAVASGALVFHAGTKWNGHDYTTGRAGRVLNVVGCSRIFWIAHDDTYRAASMIGFPDAHMRPDIGREILMTTA